MLFKGLPETVALLYYMKIGSRYKNYNEAGGFLTYEVVEFNKTNIKMSILFPSHWEIPFYETQFSCESVKKFLTNID